MNNWSYSDLLKLVEIKDKNIDHHLERITELESELERTRKALDVAMKGLYDIFTTRPNGCALNSMKAKETMDKVKRLVGANNTSVSSPACWHTKSTKVCQP